jgi:hypothetical protein
MNEQSSYNVVRSGLSKAGKTYLQLQMEVQRK